MGPITSASTNPPPLKIGPMMTGVITVAISAALGRPGKLTSVIAERTLRGVRAGLVDDRPEGPELLLQLLLEGRGQHLLAVGLPPPRLESETSHCTGSM